MKKFIIVIVFVFLIALLISFNYVLWDREKQLANYQDLSNSKNLSIDTLGEKINNLDKFNKELSARIDTLTNENTSLKENISALGDENQQIKQELSSKDSLISLLKNNLNAEPFETVIKKWVDAVNTKNYKNAQVLISKNSEDEILNNIDKFKESYQAEVKTISLKSAKLYTELTDEEHLSEIQFKVVLEVGKPDASGDNKDQIPQKIYKSGDNVKYITMTLDQDAKEWRISSVSDEP